MAIPEIVIIAAMDEKRGIGVNNTIPWRIPEDMAHFKTATVGHPVIMGRMTWESIDDRFKPLPGRTNIILTKDRAKTASDFGEEGIEVEHSVQEALAKAAKFDTERIFIMGGAQVYKDSLFLADQLDLTIVEGKFEVDSWFPDYSGWFEVYDAHPNSFDWYTSKGKMGLRYRFQTMKRDYGYSNLPFFPGEFPF